MGSINRILYELVVCKNVGFIVRQISKKIKSYKKDTLVDSYIANHEYSKAVDYLNKNNKKNNFEYAYCLQALGKQAEATEIMKSVIKIKYRYDVSKIIEFLEDRMKAEECCSLEYVYMGGYTNLGCILHICDSKIKRITKIIDVKKGCKEEKFYNNHYTAISNAIQFVPKCYDSCVFFDTFRLLTLDYVEQKSLDNNWDESVISINKVIEKYSVNDFLDNCGSSEKLYLGNNEISHLHKKITMKMIQEKIMNTLSTGMNSEKFVRTITKITGDIINKKIYKHINTRDFYSFCHNDFHRKNMFISDNKVTIIDWNNYRYGLKGWDMAYYWGNFERSFDYIREIYIEKYIHVSEQDEIYWKILFAYCLVYVWVARLHGRAIDAFWDDYFLPAIKYIEDLLTIIDDFERE